MSRPLSEKRFRALIENSADGLALLGADGAVIYASPPTTQILGYPPNEVVGRFALDQMHPDDLPRARELCLQLRKTSGASLSSQFRYQHKDGSWRWLESTANNLLAEPGVEAIVINFRDVTARKAAEEERTFFASEKFRSSLGNADRKR